MPQTVEWQCQFFYSPLSAGCCTEPVCANEEEQLWKKQREREQDMKETENTSATL